MKKEKIEFSGKSRKTGWEIVVHYKKNHFNNIVKVKNGRGGSHIMVAAIYALLPALILHLKSAGKINPPTDIIIVGCVLISIFTLPLFISLENRKNHFCEHYVANKLEGSKETWYNEGCGTIAVLTIANFCFSYLIIRGAMIYNNIGILVIILILNAILFLYQEKIKRAWQWYSMAMPEKWRLKLARQQIKEIRKELESKGIII